EKGLSFDNAVKKAQDIGVAETDPSTDVDGWDAAVKVAALATVLMDVPVTPQTIAPVGIRHLSGDMVRAARAEGKPYKLVCKAEKAGGKVVASVTPEQVEADDVLASVNGTSSIVVFEMDMIYGLTVSEIGGDAVTSAYGPLADFISIARDNQ
ncbi:MAG: homoserine dehydrogenase, partial [Anaerolineales bacterium]